MDDLKKATTYNSSLRAIFQNFNLNGIENQWLSLFEFDLKNSISINMERLRRNDIPLVIIMGKSPFLIP